MREVIVTGGAGYIGSHIAQELLDQGLEVHVIDNLRTGFREFIPEGAIFHQVDVTSAEELRAAFQSLKSPVEAGVIHAAGLKFAGESLKEPIDFYMANTLGTAQLVKVMAEFEVSNIVFSSSSSVYGSHGSAGPVQEDSLLEPISPYGRSKLFAESILRDSRVPSGINSVSLRYFNVIGSRSRCGIDVSIHNLLPNLYRAVGTEKVIQVFGETYPTPDGTCIRDYVDVRQLAKAHHVALIKLSEGVELPAAINLGSGSGFSVREIIQVLQNSVDSKINVEISAGREGDPAITLASIDLAKRVLEWNPTYSIEESITSGWDCWKAAGN
jgi:UDP-glucose 4-epimerase